MSKLTKPRLQFHTVEDVMEITRSSRPGIYARLHSYDDAIARGERPPEGSLRSVKWRSKRLIAYSWLRASLGMSEDA